MATIIYSDDFLNHITGSFHPESPARLTAICQALKKTKWANYLHWQAPTPPRERDVLTYVRQVHAPAYVEELRRLAQAGGGALDQDTPLSVQSYDVALLAVSAWLDGVDRSAQEPVFVLARPPGHHALRDRGMGFCLFNNAAIAAHYALTQPEIQRVGILDWDVHHGNGTEALVADNPHIFYCSVHQFPFYPGTGAAGDRGQFENVLNIPLGAGSGRKEYEQAFRQKVVPFLTACQPDLLIVSAGYDANQTDSLAGMNLVPFDYEQLSYFVCGLAPRLMFGLEGGYDLEVLGKSVVATLQPLME
jgi:acetoin utilization deacetylase AcuC-like enzyme